MRKPLLALGLAVCVLGTLPAAGTLAATSHPSQGATSTANSHNASGRGRVVSGAQIVRTAMRYLGYRYTTTGNSPATGFSCIGFVSFVYRSNGIPLPGGLGGALGYAPRIRFQNLLPGDVVFFKNTIWNGLSHVGIYIGGGRFIHAEWYNTGVRISTLQSYASHYMAANRPWTAPAIGAGFGTPSRSPSTGASGPSATVNAPGGLKLRNGPSKRNGVKQVIPNGTTLTVLGKHNGWYRVQLPDGTTGWVMGSYIGMGNAAIKIKPVSAPNGAGRNSNGTARFNAYPNAGRMRGRAATMVATMRVHARPWRTSRVIATISAGTHIRLLRIRGRWAHIRLPSGIKGFVFAAYVA